VIIPHQNNVAGFAGAHTYYWPLNPLLFQRIGKAEVVVVVAGQPFYLREGRYIPDFISIRQI